MRFRCFAKLGEIVETAEFEAPECLGLDPERWKFYRPDVRRDLVTAFVVGWMVATAPHLNCPPRWEVLGYQGDDRDEEIPAAPAEVFESEVE